MNKMEYRYPNKYEIYLLPLSVLIYLFFIIIISKGTLTAPRIFGIIFVGFLGLRTLVTIIIGFINGPTVIYLSDEKIEFGFLLGKLIMVEISSLDSIVQSNFMDVISNYQIIITYIHNEKRKRIFLHNGLNGLKDLTDVLKRLNPNIFIKGKRL